MNLITAFSHQDENGKITVFNITSLENDPDFHDCEIVYVPVLEEPARYCRQNRGIEEHRLSRLVDGLRSGFYLEPVYLACWQDGTHLLIEGNHRYVAAFDAGKEEILAVIIPETLWSRHLMSPVLSRLNGFSGIH